MELSLNREEMIDYTSNQLKLFFPDNLNPKFELAKYMDYTLQRVEYCFSKISNKYFFNEGNVLFNHLNSDHYSMYLYLMSNTLYKNNVDISICSKLFLLNKCLHGIDIFYEVELPNIFLFVHPIGTVLGRAKYSDYFLVYQNCNVGSNKNIYPQLGEYTSMHPGSSILGNCTIGNNSVISAGSLLLDKDLGDNSLYIGNPRDYIIKEKINKSSVWRSEI